MGSEPHIGPPIAAARPPHVVCVPFPAQGHITPMLKLAEILHHRGFHVTFVNTNYNHRRLLESRGLTSLDGFPDFRYETIPDGLPETDVDVTQDIPCLCLSTEKTCLPHFRDLITRLNASSDVPPVTCIVSDASMTFTLDAAEEFGLPEVLLCTASACGLLAYIHYKDLVQKGLIPLKDESCLSNGYLETPVDWIPGIMKGFRLRDMPSFVRTTDPNDVMVNFAQRELGRASKASAFILNTFSDLEGSVLDGISRALPKVYYVGPLHQISGQIPKSSDVAPMGSNLWKEDNKCLEWLDTKAPDSVVYVNFGSITVMNNHQMVEFAWGLCNSKKHFLWVIRPDLVRGDAAVLPMEFLEKTKERGLLTSWCSQEQVLGHSATGGFLTHCGWNSTLESISSGVPMLCWPFFAEQQTNCRYLCVEWGLGMEIDNDVKRDEVTSLILGLMDGGKGKEMRGKAQTWKDKATAATKPDGTSSANLEELVNGVLLSRYLTDVGK